MHEMGETVANRLAQLIQADGCFLTLWDNESKRTFPFAAYGVQKQAYAEVEIEPGEVSFTSSVMDLERTLIIEDTGNTPYASPSITKRFPSKSLLALPLIAMKKKLGAVIVSFDTYHHFEAEEVQICEQAASLIALALEKFQAMEDAKRRADTSETLRRAGMAITEKLELGETIEHILEQLQQVVPYDSASVQLLEGDQLTIVGGRGWEDSKQVIGIHFPVHGDNPNRVVIETGQPYYLPETEKAYKAFQTPPHNHIKSWLGVPLIAQNKIIGLLAIDSEEPSDFSAEDIKIAMEFSNQVSISLENARLFRETQTQALTDALTGIYNRRGLFQEGQFEFQRARRINRPFVAMMFDIDRFKQVNDQYGHAAGDQLLHHFAQHCLTASRATDLVGRYGGEEFIILLSETNLEVARLIGERLRQSIMNTPFETDAGEITITSSIGIAEARKQDTLETLIERADAALYKAKNLGRNRVVIDLND
jgi:diguanylate cyclase (GGDEF)-like protein